MNRREFLRYSCEAVSMVALAGIGLAFSGDGQYVRPPGAIAEDKFYKKCIKCGICVQVCPTQGLDFVGLMDLKNIGTPKLNVREGGCIAWKQPCLKCAKACPTGVLLKKTNIQKVRMGTAFIREQECINCLMCFSECPIKGAVVFPNPEGRPFIQTKDIPPLLSLKNSPFKPFIDESLCIGCGLCAHICPVHCIDITPKHEVRMLV